MHDMHYIAPTDMYAIPVLQALSAGFVAVVIGSQY